MSRQALNTLVLLVLLPALTQAIRWQHSTYLDENFRLLWNLNTDATITLEMQVRTHGYVGVGFARNANDRAGADMTIGWVEHGQTYLQDRHYKHNGAGEPRVDPQDDCQLLLGYENATHTVLRFQRALETCDTAHDVPITNSTMRVVFMYHQTEPRFGSILPGSLPQPGAAFRGIVPLQFGQRTDARKVHPSSDEDASNTSTVELISNEVPLPVVGESLEWCRVFEMNEFRQKHHMVRYEPIFGSAKGRQLLDRMVLYECQGSSVRLSAMARTEGRVCAGQYSRSAVPCNAIVASWTRGSAGLTFPAEAGVPLESNKERFYLMESHYSNSGAEEAADLHDLWSEELVDSSGLRLHVTAQLRKHDAGVMSVGMNPDWRHIIPPGQETVTSEGHCVDDCTRSAFPPAGISIFALLMQSASLGKTMRLRQIRRKEELLPIAVDTNVHENYAEYRHIQPAARVLPGDSMIVECTYDSTDRDTITVGGGARGESCNVLAVYYPRQKKLTTCHSVPSLPTILASLGIQELIGTSQPLLISAPEELAGQTLESRLLSYNWAQNFALFEQITRQGSFQAVCRDARHKTVMGSERRLHRPATVQRVWREPKRISKCAVQEREEEVEVSMSNSIDGEPDAYDAYLVQSMGWSGSSGQRNQSARIVLLVAVATVIMLKWATLV